MKRNRLLALVLALVMACSLIACGETGTNQPDGGNTGTSQPDAADTGANQPDAVPESDGGRETAAEFAFHPAAGEEIIVENKIFNEAVTVTGAEDATGENPGIVTFRNCLFNADLTLAAKTGCIVQLDPACESDGAKAIIDAGMTEATIEYSLPRISSEMPTPMEVQCEGIGSFITFNSDTCVFNGETYRLEDSEYCYDPNGELVPYVDGEYDYFYVGQWWENGEHVLFTIADWIHNCML